MFDLLRKLKTKVMSLIEENRHIDTYKISQEIKKRVEIEVSRRLLLWEKQLQVVSQARLLQQYQHLKQNVSTHDNPIRLHELAFKIYSQNAEDHIILHIFDQIGITNKRLIEFGISNGRECNAANLILNFGWGGLLLEGNSDFATSAQQYYKSQLGDGFTRLRIIHAFVHSQNINELFEEYGVTGEIDMLSIDIDGNDYWVWEAIKVVQPRIVVCEYNANLGRERSLTIPNNIDFVRGRKMGKNYYGASLMALTKLATIKGYHLIGCDSMGVNAFFLRNDIHSDALPALSVQEAFRSNQRVLLKTGTEDEVWERELKHLPFIEV